MRMMKNQNRHPPPGHGHLDRVDKTQDDDKEAEQVSREHAQSMSMTQRFACLGEKMRPWTMLERMMRKRRESPPRETNKRRKSTS